MTKNHPQLRKAASTTGISRSYRNTETMDTTDFTLRPRQSMSFDRRMREVLNEIPEERRKEPERERPFELPSPPPLPRVDSLPSGRPFSYVAPREPLISRPQRPSSEYYAQPPGFFPHEPVRSFRTTYNPPPPPPTTFPQAPPRIPEDLLGPTAEARPRPRPPPPKSLEQLFSGRTSMIPQSPEEQASPPPRPPKQPIPQPKRTVHPEEYAKPFCKFLTENPTAFHAIDAVGRDLKSNGYEKLSERDAWKLKKGGKYYVERNGSSLIAFAVGDNYEPGNGAAILAGHIDALAARLKPISALRTKAGYVQLGVAPYAGALSSTWLDRDLGVGGRVLVKESSGKIVSKLVKLDWPIARIPTLAPHFGAVAAPPLNKETQMVPVIGLDNSDMEIATKEFSKTGVLGGGSHAFASTQPPKLVKAISKELGISSYGEIVNWELELFDTQPATLLGIEKEFISAGRIDDKLCSWAAYQALIQSTNESTSSSQIKIVGLFDDEEIGSLLRQGANSNFLPTILSRAVESFAPNNTATAELISRTYANSFLISSDVTHAVNPNFLGAYLENHSPRLNVGLVVCHDSNGHLTTDSISAGILQQVAEKTGQKLQVFQIRNDVRSGGTVGPMLSAKTGIRTIDAGMPQLSMHSIRAMTGAKDPGLGVAIFQGFLDHFEEIDKAFRD